MEEESLKIIPPLRGAFFSLGNGQKRTAGNDWILGGYSSPPHTGEAFVFSSTPISAYLESKMIDYAATFEELEQVFENEGIPTDAPGFYDHPHFLALEQVQPNLLNSYARYVDTRHYSDDYLAHAGRVTRVAAHELHKLLRRYSRPILTLLPPTILTVQGERAKADATDICCPSAIEEALSRGVPRQEIIFDYRPDLRKFFSVFPSTLISVSELTLKYIPCAVGASNCPLDKITSLTLCEKPAGQLYREYIAPRLRGV